MLTLDSILKTTKQMTSYGEGKHRFGHGTERLPAQKIPRDSSPPKAKE